MKNLWLSLGCLLSSGAGSCLALAAVLLAAPGSRAQVLLRLEAGLMHPPSAPLLQGQPVTLFANLVNESARAAWTSADAAYQREVVRAMGSRAVLAPFEYTTPPALQATLPPGAGAWFQRVDLSLVRVTDEGKALETYWPSELIHAWVAGYGAARGETPLTADPVYALVIVDPVQTATLPAGTYQLRARYEWVESEKVKWLVDSKPETLVVKAPVLPEEFLRINMMTAKYYSRLGNASKAVEFALKVVETAPGYAEGEALMILGNASNAAGDKGKALAYFQQCLSVKQLAGDSDTAALKRVIDDLSKADK